MDPVQEQKFPGLMKIEKWLKRINQEMISVIWLLCDAGNGKGNN